MEECGAKAKEQGRILMNYDAVGKKCYTSKTCPQAAQISGVRTGAGWVNYAGQ